MPNAPVRILIALAAGLIAGIAAAAWTPAFAVAAGGIADLIGGLWLSALKMTIIPLIVALLVTGIAQTAEAARAGRIAARAMAWFVGLLWATTIAAAIVVPAILARWPLPTQAAATLKRAMGTAAPPGPVVGIADFFRSLIPSNPIAAAANDAILPLVIFTALFAFAVTRLDPDARERITGLFKAIGDAMLLLIGWVLTLAPIGVFALAFVVAAKTGASAFGALAHYVAVVSVMGILVGLSAYPVAMLFGRVSLRRFARAAIAPQAVAISTQSSLASLPAMLRATGELGVPVQTADVTLPLAVALFRATSPSMNLAVALYVAHWYGIALTPGALAAGIATAAITTMGSVSLPGTLTYFLNIAPVALAMGVPLEPLALLVAVETIPDIFRTVGNVTMDVAVTAVIGRNDPGDQP